MKLSSLSFDNDFIYAQDETGKMYKQSLLWYPALITATQEQRQNYTVGFGGFHWRDLDEDISFESFTYEDAVPSTFQEFFLVHKEINVSEFAKRFGINRKRIAAGFGLSGRMGLFSYREYSNYSNNIIYFT